MSHCSRLCAILTDILLRNMKLKTNPDGLIDQFADDGKWLYKDQDDNRLFRKVVYLGRGATPWQECTEEDMLKWYEEWERNHPDPQPEE